MKPRFVLYHAPNSRAAAIRWLLEEANTPYDIVAFDLRKGTHKTDVDYGALNPHRKVPTLVDRGPDGTWDVVLTESAAIAAYIADALPEARLAPAIGSQLRGPYLTWMAYRPAVVEPSLADVVFPRQATPPASAIGWPTFAEAIERIENTLARGPYLLGEQFTAADVVIGSMLRWVKAWGKLPESPAIGRYLTMLGERDALKRAEALDAKLSANAKH